MFKELQTLIATRPLTLTVVAVADGKIRVCVVPQSIDKDDSANKRIAHRKEVAKIPVESIKALTTPLSLTGTPEELDAELPGILTQYVEKHVGLQETLVRATTEIDNAVTAIEDREKERAKAAKAAKRDDKKDDKKADDKKTQEPKDDGIPSLWCAPVNNQPSGSTTQIANTEACKLTE